MKIQYASDLHLKLSDNKNFIRDNPLKPVGDILILAGDIIPVYFNKKMSGFINYSLLIAFARS